MSGTRLRSDGIAWEVVEDEVVILDLSSSEYFGLNSTGTALWHALLEGASDDELIQTLLDTFDVDDAQARTDVTAFLSALRAHGLLEPTTA